MTDTNYGIQLLKVTTVIGEVTNLSFPEIKQDAVEKTNHSSGGVRQYVSSQLREITEFTVSINAVQAQMDILEDDLKLGTIAVYNIEYPASLALDDWAFSAFPVNMAMQDADAQSPDVLAMDITFRPTGDVTISG